MVLVDSYKAGGLMISTELLEALGGLKKPDNQPYTYCTVGHDSHDTKVVTRSLGGGPALEVEIYEWRNYFLTENGNETVPRWPGNYCPAQDIISYCIDTRGPEGVWERDETRVICNILDQPGFDRVVLDVGSQVGYYSLIAAARGFSVAAMDTSADNLKCLSNSAERNNLDIAQYRCWIDDDAEALPAVDDVRLVKIDIEGAEVHAISMLTPLLAARRIHHLVVEISPVFNDTYPDLVENIAGHGYDVAVIDGCAPDALRPLPAAGRRDYVAGLHQENFLFTRTT